MEVAEGEVRAVIGPNGAGKSTLSNLITGISKPSDGTVRFAGERLTGLPVPRICQRGIARTFQLTALFPEMTAREYAACCPSGASLGTGDFSAAVQRSHQPASAPIWRSNDWVSQRS